MGLCVLVTGTPGTGKSTLCARLVETLQEKGVQSRLLLVNDEIRKHKLYERYDARLDTHIIDDRRVRSHIKRVLASEELSAPGLVVVVETHTVTAVPKGAPALVIVLGARTDVLYDRLQARGYSSHKVSENMECEIMRVVLDDAQHRFGDVLELPSNDASDVESNVAEILERLSIS